MNPGPRCPSELALEGHLMDPERSIVALHVAACASCQARLARMRLEGEEFTRTVFPATIDAVEAAARRRPWWLRPAVLLPVPAVAALAAVLFVAAPRDPPDGYVGLKGGAGGLALTLFTPGPSGVGAVLDGGTVQASASIRFRVRATAACHLWILSVDATGAVSRLYPPSGDRAGLVVAGEQDLPGGAILDGRLGPERIYAICSPHAYPWAEAQAVVQASVSRPASVRAPAPASGLPAGATWTSLVLEKRP